MEKEFFCDDCEAEFKIISDNTDPVEYCPYCSNIIKNEEEEDDWFSDDGC